MFKLRAEVLEALGEVSRRVFEDRMVAHLSAAFPAITRPRKEADTRELIRTGVERAKAHGLETEGQICRYIELMCKLGPDFDRDPELPWASAILSSAMSADSRVHQLALMAGGR